MASNPTHLNPHQCIEVPLTIIGTGISITIKALVNSGLAETLIDESLATAVALPIRRHDIARIVKGVDGRPLIQSIVSYVTGPLPTGIGLHGEYLSFKLAKLGSHQVVLGIPWLKQHNPQINWSTGKVHFTSQYCMDHCQSYQKSGTKGLNLTAPKKEEEEKTQFTLSQNSI